LDTSEELNELIDTCLVNSLLIWKLDE